MLLATSVRHILLLAAFAITGCEDSGETSLNIEVRDRQGVDVREMIYALNWHLFGTRTTVGIDRFGKGPADPLLFEIQSPLPKRELLARLDPLDLTPSSEKKVDFVWKVSPDPVNEAAKQFEAYLNSGGKRTARERRE